jgi:hypothetical protein
MQDRSPIDDAKQINSDLKNLRKQVGPRVNVQEYKAIAAQPKKIAKRMVKRAPGK